MRRCAPFLFLCLCVSSLGRPLRVGVSSTSVNPKNGVCLAGYGLNRLCTGVHDDLFVKAIVFDDEENSVALVVVDSIGIQYDTILKIRDKARAKKNIAVLPENIIVCSTHTHCSPDVIGIYGPNETTSGRDPEYMKMLTDAVVAQVKQACLSRKPAKIFHAQTQGGSWAVNDSEPGDTIQEVVILQCREASGKVMATLTHFACHPTVLDGDTTEVSSDWVGAFYKKLDKSLEGVNFYLQGGVGGWIQPETPERTFRLAQKYGEDLSTRVLKALIEAKEVNGTPVQFGSKVFGMPNENPKYMAMAAAGLVPRPMAETIQTEVAWFAVGDVQFATHPGETAPQFTRATWKLMDTGPKIVLGLGLDELGYILKSEYFDDPTAFPAGPYLTGMSPGRSAGRVMMTALGEIIP